MLRSVPTQQHGSLDCRKMVLKLRRRKGGPHLSFESYREKEEEGTGERFASP